MLVDEITTTIKAGNGGNGAVSFLPQKGGPAGGNGGNGGDVYLLGTPDITALSNIKFKNLIKAPDGEPGGKQHMFGHNAEDLYIKVPIGTRIEVDNSGWIYEIKDTKTPFLIAHGGKGGRGNDEFKSATNQTPQYAEKGAPGQEKQVHLQLRLIAHVGFVGLPNAGKSSLLQALTNATPKIGNYPFTTLEPNLGMMGEIILADIPGLIEGASQGKGLGIKFLKHIEKTELLAHCIDISSEQPLDDYQTVRQEFQKYNKQLLDKPEIIILTKTDLVDEKERNKKIKLMQKLHKPILTVSIIDEASIQSLQKNLSLPHA